MWVISGYLFLEFPVSFSYVCILWCCQYNKIDKISSREAYSKTSSKTWLAIVRVQKAENFSYVWHIFPAVHTVWIKR